MPLEPASDVKFEICHVLFMDVVGYSKLRINQQSELLRELNEIVSGTSQFCKADAAGKLIRLPTGDGMALVFRINPEAPARCALEISQALKSHPNIQLRMGVHSGLVNEVADVNQRANIAGAGINIAQRVMDCGDAGHILISKHAAEDLEQYEHWQPHLHDLGECEVKHGARVHVVNLYTEELGNSETPEKFKQAAGARGVAAPAISKPVERSTTRRWATVGALFLVIAAVVSGLVIFLAKRLPPSRVSSTITPEKSIAVLPFENLSGDPSNAYFTEGVQEEILTRLSKIAELKVISRASTQRFKSSPDNLPQIAKQLGVANILQGSVQKAADQVRVSVQLINAASDTHLWAESFDRKLTDIFAVETDIAKAIAETLRVRLTGAERQQLAKRPTENLIAFQYYMQGRSYSQRRTRDDLLTAIRYCEKSIEEDQNYALAYAGLADAYTNLGAFGYVAPIEGRRKGEEAARKALALDENLAEAHVAFGQTYVQFSPSNFSLGDRELRRAIDLSPSLATAHFYLGISLVRQGRVDEGLEELLKAREFDPLSSITARAVTLPYYLKRDYVRALELLRQASELGRAFSSTFEIGIYIQNRLFDEALAELKKAERDRKNDPILIYDTGTVYAARGERAEALQIIKNLEEMSGTSLSEAQWIAKIYAALNEKEQALTWLERGLATGAIGFFYKDEPVWDSIRSNPRFKAVVTKVFSPQDGSTR
jgi:TolB-like protein/class 3 adenylate cyclase/Flp pilus assembly protein TadD